MNENTGIVITLREEDFLVKTSDEAPIKLLVIPLSIEGEDAVSVVEAIDIDTKVPTYSVVVPEHNGDDKSTWENAIKVASIVMAQMDQLIERGVFTEDGTE